MDTIAVPVCFVGEEEVYEILWTELLTLDTEEPFCDLKDIVEGMKVKAPWVCGERVDYSEAVVLAIDNTGK